MEASVSPAAGGASDLSQPQVPLASPASCGLDALGELEKLESLEGWLAEALARAFSPVAEDGRLSEPCEDSDTFGLGFDEELCGCWLGAVWLRRGIVRGCFRLFVSV